MQNKLDKICKERTTNTLNYKKILAYEIYCIKTIHKIIQYKINLDGENYKYIIIKVKLLIS